MIRPYSIPSNMKLVMTQGLGKAVHVMLWCRYIGRSRDRQSHIN
jgi:hypothetical protein